METGRVRIGSIVIDCTDFHRMLAFWQDALHYVPKYPPEDGWVILKDPEGRHSASRVFEDGRARDLDDLFPTKQHVMLGRLARYAEKTVGD